MKSCPKCGANVEGLLYWCDCCLAPLVTTPRLFSCLTFDLPGCYNFGEIANEITDKLNKCSSGWKIKYLQNVGFVLICLPNAMVQDMKISDSVRYYAKTASAKLNVVVNFNEYISATPEQRRSMIATQMYAALKLLQERLINRKLNSIDLVALVEPIFQTMASISQSS